MTPASDSAWPEYTLAELAADGGLFTDGDWVLAEDLKSGTDVRLLQLGDVGVGRFLNKSSKWISQDRSTELDCTFLAPGDILISRMADPIVRACRLPAFPHRAITAVDVAILRLGPDSPHNPDFIVHALNDPLFRYRAEQLASGVTRKRISRKNLSRLALRLPDRAQQNFLVDAVDRLLEQVEAGGRQVAQCRDAEAAFSTTLRRAALDGTLLPGLKADMWKEIALADAAVDEPRAFTDGPFGSNLKREHYVSEGPRVLSLRNVGDGVFVDAYAHISPEHFAALRDTHEVQGGDVLVGALGDLLPRACVVPDGVGPAVNKSDCPRIRVGPEVDPQYLALAINAPQTRAQGEAMVHGVGRQRLNLRELKKLRIPLPDLVDQEAIVAAYRDKMTGYGILMDGLPSAERGRSLREAILRSACSGALHNNSRAGQEV